MTQVAYGIMLFCTCLFFWGMYRVSFVGLLHALDGCSDLCVAGKATEAIGFE